MVIISDEELNRHFQSVKKLHAPNTDSRGLLEAFRTDFNHIGDGRILVEPQELADYILAYTANKQREILEGVEQELPSKYRLHKGNKIRGALNAAQKADNVWSEGFNSALNQVREQLKNKKESL